MGGAWMPVWNSAAASKSGEVYWPVAIRNQELCSIMCPKQQPYPLVSAFFFASLLFFFASPLSFTKKGGLLPAFLYSGEEVLRETFATRSCARSLKPSTSHAAWHSIMTGWILFSG
eukprot:1141017-Pelagomonas_calceolata.AAC.7